jgi:putative membrane protein
MIVAAAVPAFAACATVPASDTASAAGNVTPAMIESTPIAVMEADMLRRMTDPNILGHIAMSDSVEVVMAQFAQKRTRSDDILSYARQMDVDHSSDRAKVRDLAQTTGVGMHTIAGELKASHMGSMVDSVGPQISEITFDRNYVLANLQMHQHMLAELQTLQSVAQNSAVRDHIAAMLPVVQGHLNGARDLARKYGYGSKPLMTRP